MGTQVALTINDFMELPEREDGAVYELDAGELIVLAKPGARHELVKVQMTEILVPYLVSHEKPGRLFIEAGFTLNADTLRIPDLAIVLRENLSRISKEDMPIPIPPDVAIEVISPTDTIRYLERKIEQYLSAGVKEVWIAHPELNKIHVRKRGEVRELIGDDVLETPLLPGLRINVRELF